MENINPQNDRIIMPESAKQSTSDWSIGDLYSNAWRITKKFKVLWIFGIATLGSGGLSNYTNLLNSNSSSPTQSPSPSPLPTFENTDKLLNFNNTQNILGLQTQSENIISSLFANINFGVWFLLGLEVLLLIVIGITLSIIFNAWATSALLSATDDAIDEKNVTIESASANALSKIKSMAWIQIVPGFILFITSILALIIPFIMLYLGQSLIYLFVISIVLIIVIGLIILYFSILTTLSITWGTRIIANENVSGREAFWRGWRISKKKKWAMLGLSFVNIVVGGILIAIPIIVLIAIIAGILFATYSISNFQFENLNNASYIFVPLIILILMSLIIFFTLGSGIFNAFKTIVWSLAYRKIKGKYDDK